MIAYIIAQLGLTLFNIGNAAFDAHRIMMGYRIYHGINFGIYVLVAGGICWVGHFDLGTIILFAVSAFCNRQLSFDIPLNLMRGLKWDYVSTAKPPKSLTDRIEIWLFGYNGRAPVFMYAAIWLACLIIKMLL